MSYVESVHRGNIATLTLTDPARRNALSLELVGELCAAVEAAEADPAVRCLIVTGTPPAFCAGAVRTDLASPSERGLRAIYEGFLRVARSPLPTIAAVNGAAVGAGFNLALACDLRLAGASARFDARFLRLGIHPGGGHTWLLRRAVGPAAAAAITLFSEVIDGENAQRIGLAWRCLPDADLLAVADDIAGHLADVPAELARRTKATLARMSNVDSHADAVEAELGEQLWSVQQPGYTP